MPNSMFVNKDFLAWLLIGSQLCCQPIRCQVWKSLLTRTTKTPAYWDTPTTPWLPILVIHISPKSKQDKVKVTNFKELPKIQISKFCKKRYTWHTLWSCLIKMYKYEMDPSRTVGATEQTRDAGLTDGRTDRRTDRNQYTPNNFVVQGYNNN